LVLRQDLLAQTLKRLRMFVMRAKVVLNDVSEQYEVRGVLGNALPASLAPAPWSLQLDAQAWTLRLYPGQTQGRALHIVPVGTALSAPALPLQDWLLSEVLSGVADVQAAISHGSMATRGKVGVVGYCWGGLLSWRAATQFANVKAAVTYYGGGMTLEPELHKKPLCPTMAHFGAKDSLIPASTVQAFQQAQPKVNVNIYDADHGFNCDQRGSYNAAAADLALERTLGFFIQHLEG
jgi:pimeloyl-ACP methyl ester carboxylesterase